MHSFSVHCVLCSFTHNGVGLKVLCPDREVFLSVQCVALYKHCKIWCTQYEQTEQTTKLPCNEVKRLLSRNNVLLRGQSVVD